MLRGITIGVVLVVVFSPIQGQPKQPTTREEDLELLQGRWVQVKPDGKNLFLLTIGAVLEKELHKNYLIVSETVSKNGKMELVKGSWGSFGLPDEKGKRVISYSMKKDGISYKLEGDKLFLDGVYDAPSLKQKLTGEWKKMPPSLPLGDARQSILGKWERAGNKDDPRLVLEFLADTEKKDRIELITRPYRRKDNELDKAHHGGIFLREEAVIGLPNLIGRDDLEKALPRRQYFNREKVSIYFELNNEKLKLEGEYEWKGHKFNVTGEWTKVKESK